MASYSSDQLVAHATADGQMVPTTQRARVTSIQAEGAASSKIIVLKSWWSCWNYNSYVINLELKELTLYIPGSGILFEEGVYLDLTATPGVTITFT